MNKKFFIPLIGFVALIVLLSLSLPSYSQEGLPYSPIGPDKDKPAVCHQEFLNEMHVMRNAWEANIASITGQERPASEMVDEAFESTRTFRCWLEYLCRTVQYSGTADPALPPRPILTPHVGRIPGCAKPENLQIPGTELHVMENCRASASSTVTVPDVQNNFNACQRYVELNFGVPKAGTESAEMVKNLSDQSNVYIVLESVLKRVNGRQRARAVESKLIDILNRMQAMEGQVQYLKNFLNKLYALLPCTLAQCD